MSIRAERRARARQKIKDLKKELLDVFLRGVNNKDYSCESTMRDLDRTVIIMTSRNPQESHLVRTACIELTADIKAVVQRERENDGKNNVGS